MEGLGFRVQGLGVRIQGAGCRVQGSGFRVEGLVRVRVQIGFRYGVGMVQVGLGCRWG